MKYSSSALVASLAISLGVPAHAGMIANWTFDDAQSNMWLVGGGPHGHPDDATDNFDGQYFSYSGAGGVVGDPQFNVYSVPGKVGSAADFGAPDGTLEGHNSHASVSLSTIIAQDTTATAASWFKLSSTQAGRKWIFIDSGIWGLNVDGDKLQFAYHNGGWNYVSSSVSLSLDTWYHGSIARNGTDLALRIIEENGTVHTDIFSVLGVVSNISGQTLVGGAGLGESFGGVIDDIKLFDTTLTESELLTEAGVNVIPSPMASLAGVAGLLVVTVSRRRRS